MQLNLSRSFSGIDQEALTLRRDALMTKHKADKHLQTVRMPIAKQTIRKNTNAAILDHERDQKALVLSLREIEQQGIQGWSHFFFTTVGSASCSHKRT